MTSLSFSVMFTRGSDPLSAVLLSVAQFLLWPNFNLEHLQQRGKPRASKYETVCLVFASSCEPAAQMFLAFSYSESSSKWARARLGG